ncbi:16S rRNA (guanine(527)-N(7))-methyltransferase RsmG [Dictyobacter arantiisoli]|uniref:Ribosomal RNA small subunit methyltransferase G n=1 Tax=Dictyobacter arantiisoli TaxID=2014874 RepID=A0A5A5THZ5_9CHLR|nr:16S rRNA (guanine(527)-N(7))-methyltransferase RsmG [Dictyobacter arantiisoli]GCF10756.1 ribosomal RNA small subunit methyltransferase G [Dictyobacter arantiisoli]
MSDQISTVFQAGLAQLGLADSEHIVNAFLRYRQELLDWNTRFNLTAIKDPEEVLTKHFLDSLSLLQIYDTQEPVRILDIGSGAGFPGIPLKIVRPQWRVTLIEATGKKITFLQHMVDTLQLENVEVLHGRAEDIAHQPKYRGHFDMVTARAVSALPALLECCAPFCRKGGALVLPKKGDMADEIARGRRAGGLVGTHLKADQPVTLPDLTDGRRLLLWIQEKPSPTLYPRSWALLTKKPLP